MFLARRGLTAIVAVLSVVLLEIESSSIHDFDTIPAYSQNVWSWRFPQSGDYHTADRRIDDELDSASAEKREPLGPDYKDPKGGDEGKPSYNPSVLPGGVLDVDAADGFGLPNLGIPSFGDIHGSFGFGNGQGNRRPGGLFGLGGFFSSLDEYKPWWKGENVCIEREESTDDEEEPVENEKNKTEIERVPNFFSTSISLSNCHQTPSKYECITKINNHGVVKTFTVRYKCCYGFERSENAPGCNKQLELKTLSETIQQLDGKEFKIMVDMVGLGDDIDEGNYTIFLPTDAAIGEFEDKMNDMNRVEAVRRRRDAVSSTELVRNHFVDGFIDLNDLTNEELINSENDNKTIRINVYPTRSFEKMMTANCVRVKKANNLAKNGIVHIMDGVMHPASLNIVELIEENPKLTNLRKVLENTDLVSYFKQDGHYTIFAPTDEAFNKLDEKTKQKLLSGKGCAANILKHHIVGNTICSSAIIGNATTHNIVGEILEMERTEENKLIIEDVANIEKSDIIATNGVVHLIDTVIIPESALYLSDALKNNNLTRFYELIEDAEIEDEMNAFENATVFVPSDEAFEQPEAKKYLEQLGNDKEKLREFVKYHTIKGQLETCNMDNNAKLETESNGKQLRVNLYSTLPLFANIVNRATVNCARLTNFDEKSCGSVVHEVDKILIPPQQNVMEFIETNENFTVLRKIIDGTGVDKILRDGEQLITFVAPNDDAFKNIDEADMNTLMEDKEKAAAVLKNHIITEILCCSGVGPQTWGFNSVVPTMSGQHQQVFRSGANIRIGRALVTKCDTSATNGVVHTINRVLFPQRPHNPQFGFFLFDI